MKRLTLFFFAALICSVGLYAQVSLGGEPYSFRSEITALDDADLAAQMINSPNLASLKSEDTNSDKNGNPQRYAVLQKANFTLDNAGQWTTLENGDRVWKLKISASEAKAINLLYSNFYLPPTARFFIYNEDRSEVLGAFSARNNKSNGLFATGNVLGSTSILEYYEPAAVSGEGIIDISKVGYVYRSAQVRQEKNSEPCEVDVNCSEGNNWKKQKKGVVRISIVSGSDQYWCTGSLINNTAQDCKPYILSAMHCTMDSSPNDFSQYIFYFNYESSGCGNGNAPQNQSITGCVKRVDGGDSGGDQGSDFVLVELTNSIPDNYDPYYNGWNANNTASPNGVGIHHPAGDRKKISTYNSTASSGTWQSVPNTHWEVQWVSTANGYGVTEGGSSGSPLFNNAGLIVGQLTGGGSYCSTPSVSDAYGKMSYNWTSNPGGKLKQLLDPNNSGAKVLNGSASPCSDGGGGGGDEPSCDDGIQNGDETGVDCGGSCSPCDTGGGGGDGNSCDIAAVNPSTGEALANEACVAQVQAADEYCCNTEWDGLCQEAYDTCAGTDSGNNDDSCQKPTSFFLSNVKTHKVTVNWNNISGAEKYKIRYREAGYNDPWEVKTTTLNKKTLFNLYWDTKYEYQVKTKCADGWTAWTGKKNFWTAGWNSAPVEDGVEKVLTAKVSPNPSTGLVRVEGRAWDEDTVIRVFSTIGEELLVKETEGRTNLRLDLNHLSDGIYFINIESKEEVTSRRLVLTRR